MKTLNSVKWIDPKGVKADINFFEGLIDDYINRNLGSIQFIMHTKTMIARVTRISKDGSRVADLSMLEYRLDKLLARTRVLEDEEHVRLKVRDIADEVIEHMYKEYVKL